jgi:hypothetical protein
MFITKTALPRRTFLRGLGTTLALPLLDAMVPALTAMRQTAAQPVPRLGFFYVPNGIYPSAWRPVREGSSFALAPTMSALAPFRDQMVPITGLSNWEAEPRGEGGGVHSRIGPSWLSGSRPKRTEGSDYRCGITADQIAARELGKGTPLSSIELTVDPGFLVGNCENGYSCVYTSSLCWRDATTPLPMEADPRAVFERLFGEADTPDGRLRDLRDDRSILDAVADDVGRLQAKLGNADRRVLGEYLDTVRGVESRIRLTEQYNSRSPVRADKPLSVPDAYDDHVKLLFDLLVLGYRSDVTRVHTFQYGRELSLRSYPWIGVPDAHHGVSHHGGSPSSVLGYTKINAYHVTLFADFLQKMRSTPDGDGTLLDHSIFVYGAGMSDGDLHSPLDLPTVLVGGGCGKLKGDRFLEYPLEAKSRMSNLLLTLLDKVGVPEQALGDSTSRLPELLAGV